ncbi:Ail/Lom family outer membrane beta-barrel protein [Edaphovirga cremea]|uniref:Ail/Lom family outer membrane beta-barrel protein n=1 Tax=Edaphovirga cremea TaxID=2267246 RepID=UPI0039891BC0
MKKIIALATLASCISFGMAAAYADAGKQTISVGYAHSSVDWDGIDVDGDPSGLNLKYRYEFDDQFGIIGSFTYTQKDYHAYTSTMRYAGKLDLDYYSLTVGPTFRANDYFSAYLLVGMARGKYDLKSDYYMNESETQSAFAYGGGIQINPLPNWVIDASYEYSKLDNVKVGTWVLGVGYSF